MTLSELRKKRDDARKFLASIFTESLSKKDDGSKEYDFRKVTVLKDGIDTLEGTEKSVKVAEKVRELNAELDEICKQVEDLEAAEKSAEDFHKRESTFNRQPLPGSPEEKEQKTVGQRVIEHATFKKWCAGSKDGKIELADVSINSLKTLFQTSAGWLGESTRIGQVVDAVTRPLQILDIMPVAQTGQPSVVYMEETTRTHAAVERAEGAAAAESTFVLTARTSPVREFADSIPVTDIQLEDVPMVSSYLEGRVRFGIRQKFDERIVSGDGAGSNIKGIINTSGIQTQAKGADPIPDAIHKAMTLLRVTGRVVPTHYVTHSTDWEKVRLLRTADGIYIWGNPSEAGPERIWGLPVVLNESLTVGTGLVGSFEPAWISLFERRGVIIERGFVGTQFTEGKQTIRGSMRAALVVFRPAAMATVTGI
ncbi:hypothetical protein LCGC14_2150860 [marine sediment metagenome]|uniref:Phage capsid-like C-terminal domain-containing protein n=2 Tax=marine sediment metagenome TaxID=412755 RepID=A0A0F9G8M5_9ZZZZ